MIAPTTDMIGISSALSGQLDAGLLLLSEIQAVLLGARTGNAEVVDAFCGHCLENEAPVAVRYDFGAHVLARIDAYEAQTSLAREAALAAGSALQELLDLPEPLRDITLVAAGKAGWAFVAPGVKSMRLETGGSLVTKLLRIEPGYGAPNHDHTGTEYTLVVKGAFDDGLGHYQVGDLSIKRAGQIHHPVAGAGCVCFAISVEEGEVAFTGALGVLQRLFTRH
jgi:putative transcriptional regulator